eukprot:746005-Hanusia_phi.AAC.4
MDWKDFGDCKWRGVKGFDISSGLSTIFMGKFAIVSNLGEQQAFDCSAGYVYSQHSGIASTLITDSEYPQRVAINLVEAILVECSLLCHLLCWVDGGAGRVSVEIYRGQHITIVTRLLHGLSCKMRTMH